MKGTCRAGACPPPSLWPGLLSGGLRSRHHSLLLLAVGLAGCTFLNELDPSLLQPAASCPELDPPELRVPMAGSFVGSLRSPSTYSGTFVWTHREGVDYELELVPRGSPGDTLRFQTSGGDCADRGSIEPPLACQRVGAEAFGVQAGQSPALGTAWSWRVRSCCGGVCGDWSSSRRFELTRSRTDLDGDGYSELLVAGSQAGVSAAGLVRIFFGRPGAIFDPSAPTPRAVRIRPSTAIRSGFGNEPGSFAWTGDVNGDGFSDFGIGAGFQDVIGALVDVEAVGRAYFYWGGARPDQQHPMILSPDLEEPGLHFGRQLRGFDGDGDGCAEVAVTGEGAFSGKGAVWIFGLPPACSCGNCAAPEQLVVRARIEGEVTAQSFGTSLLSSGDFDGDGIEELVINDRVEGRARARIFSLSSSWDPEIASQILDDNFDLGVLGYATGDFDGDGLSDLLGVRESDGSVLAYFGADFQRSCERCAWRPLLVSPSFGSELQTVASGEDLNGDGFDDFVVTDLRTAAFVHLGSPRRELLPEIVSTILPIGECWQRTSLETRFGYGASLVGDFNGDGFGELVLTDPHALSITEVCPDDGGCIEIAGGAFTVYSGGPGRAFLGISNACYWGGRSEQLGSAVALP